MSQAGHLSWMATGSQMSASFPSGDRDPARLAQLPSYSLLGCLGEGGERLLGSICHLSSFPGA